MKMALVGIGGMGLNIINEVYKKDIKIEKIAIDVQKHTLNSTHADKKILIGEKVTKGSGTGSKPLLGERSALVDTKKIEKTLEKVDLIFIASGLGGGTGTGAISVVNQIAKEKNIKTIALTTSPFRFEGKRRMEQAKEKTNEIMHEFDVFVKIDNDSLKEQTVRRKVPMGLKQAFKELDKVICSIIKDTLALDEVSKVGKNEVQKIVQYRTSKFQRAII